MIDKNTVYIFDEAELVDSNGKIFQYDDYEFISSSIKVIHPVTRQEMQGFDWQPSKRRIIFDDNQNLDYVFIEGDTLDIDNFRADACEMIAVDFRKLQNYSIQNTSGNLDSAKEHLLRLARFFRKPKMKVEW
ncbi:MAG: hypothetical protein ABDH59_08635 [Fervidobacterium sp.]